MPIVIKKKVSLDFLGDEYKDAFLTFQSIPLKEFGEVSDKINQAKGNTAASQIILDVLKQYFVGGDFPGIEKLTKDDLDGLDIESVTRCFEIFTGVELTKEPGTEVPEVADLKAESANTSGITPPNP